MRDRVVTCLSMGLMLLGCVAQPVFTDRGSSNGTSVSFDLNEGVYTIAYSVMDREPWFGCNFNVGIAHPAGDPLAPGRTVAATEVVDVQPRGRIDGQFVTPSLARGTYFLEYGGDEPCDWVVRVVPGP